VDARLFLLNGRQVTFLTDVDIQTVAKAILAALKGRAVAKTEYTHNIPVIQIRGPGVDVAIRGEDWQQIIPYLIDGSLEDVPERPMGNYDPQSFDDIAFKEQNLYLHILAVLEKTFTTKYPT